MKKTLMAMAAAGAFAAAMFASGEAMAAKVVNHVAGGGTNTGLNSLVGDVGVWTYGFTARLDVDGVVKGQAQFIRRDDAGIRLHVVISCLSVSGNQAWLGGIISESSFPGAVGFPIVFQVEDGGGADQISEIFTRDNADACLDQEILNLQDWENGNVTIH